MKELSNQNYFNNKNEELNQNTLNSDQKVNIILNKKSNSGKEVNSLFSFKSNQNQITNENISLIPIKTNSKNSNLLESFKINDYFKNNNSPSKFDFDKGLKKYFGLNEHELNSKFSRKASSINNHKTPEKFNVKTINKIDNYTINKNLSPVFFQKENRMNFNQKITSNFAKSFSPKDKYKNLIASQIDISEIKKEEDLEISIKTQNLGSFYLKNDQTVFKKYKKTKKCCNRNHYNSRLNKTWLQRLTKILDLSSRDANKNIINIFFSPQIVQNPKIFREFIDMNKNSCSKNKINTSNSENEHYHNMTIKKNTIHINSLFISSMKDSILIT